MEKEANDLIAYFVEDFLVSAKGFLKSLEDIRSIYFESDVSPRKTRLNESEEKNRKESINNMNLLIQRMSDDITNIKFCLERNLILSSEALKETNRNFVDLYGTVTFVKAKLKTLEYDKSVVEIKEKFLEKINELLSAIDEYNNRNSEKLYGWDEMKLEFRKLEDEV